MCLCLLAQHTIKFSRKLSVIIKRTLKDSGDLEKAAACIVLPFLSYDSLCSHNMEAALRQEAGSCEK